MKYLFFIFIISLLGSCKKESSEIIFHGQFKKIDLNKIPKMKLTGAKIELDDIQTGTVYVHDSLIIYESSKFPDYNIRVYNLKNNDLMGEFIIRGWGPDEMDYVVNPIRFFEINGELKAWLYHVNGRKMNLFNISKSLETKSTVFEYSIDVLRGEVPFNYLNIIKGHDFLLKETSEIEIDGVSKVSYKILEKDSIEYKREYNIFDLINLPKDQSKVFMDHRVFYGSFDIIKPDGTRVVMGMYNFPQINILDLELGQIQGVQVKDVNWNYINTNPREAISYYRSLACTDEYIYALYLEKPVDYLETKPIDTSANIVHVFDWSGNLLYIVELDKFLSRITIDVTTGFLYGINFEDELFLFDLPSRLLLH